MLTQYLFFPSSLVTHWFYSRGPCAKPPVQSGVANREIITWVFQETSSVGVDWAVYFLTLLPLLPPFWAPHVHKMAGAALVPSSSSFKPAKRKSNFLLAQTKPQICFSSPDCLFWAASNPWLRHVDDVLVGSSWVTYPGPRPVLEVASLAPPKQNRSFVARRSGGR